MIEFHEYHQFYAAGEREDGVEQAFAIACQVTEEILIEARAFAENDYVKVGDYLTLVIPRQFERQVYRVLAEDFEVFLPTPQILSPVVYRVDGDKEEVFFPNSFISGTLQMSSGLGVEWEKQ